MKEKWYNDTEGNQFGLKKLMCVMLINELEARHLPEIGLKDVRIVRLEEAITSKTDDFQNEEK